MAALRITNKLPQFVANVETKAARNMTQALILGASEASVLTPIDTSTLLNSQFRQIKQEGSQVIGTVGYTANYALPVHDPAHPQNFRRATAQKEFLKVGFERAEPNIKAVLVGAIKT